MQSIPYKNFHRFELSAIRLRGELLEIEKESEKEKKRERKREREKEKEIKR